MEVDVSVFSNNQDVDMIGNDIVDLRLAKIKSKWQRKGFLDKIFTEEERVEILNSKNPFQLVWLFWSMKESAYKIYVQKYQDRFFAPKKFKCQLVSKTQGMVNINAEQYYTNVKITTDYIFTEAVEENTNTIWRDFFELKCVQHSAQSKRVRFKLKNMISKKHALSIHTLDIKKNGIGVPKLYQNNKLVAISFSMTHHGKYGAYSILNILK